MIASLYIISLLQSITLAHFVLQYPPSLGFDDTKEGQGPCGSFPIPSADDGSAKTTDWPVRGAPVDVLTTHTKSLWTYKVALLNATDSFINLQPNVDQQGVGEFCLTTVPGKKEWVGQEAVLQITQTAFDGTLCQCAIVNFTDSQLDAIDTLTCKNATSIKATFASSPGAESRPPSASTSAYSAASKRYGSIRTRFQMAASALLAAIITYSL